MPTVAGPPWTVNDSAGALPRSPLILPDLPIDDLVAMLDRHELGLAPARLDGAADVPLSRTAGREPAPAKSGGGAQPAGLGG